jgi:hypothetical protein
MRVFGVLYVLVPLLASPAALAQGSPQDRAAAETLFSEGKHLLETGDTAAACPKFEESQRLDPGIGTMFNLATCYEKLGRTASAWILYREVASEARANGQSDREAYAKAQAERLAPMLSRLTIEVSIGVRGIEGLEIRHDGQIVGPAQWGVPLPVDLGEHSVVATAPGYGRFETVTRLDENGQSRRVFIAALPRPDVRGSQQASPRERRVPLHVEPDAEASPTLGYVLAGVGLAGLATGAIAGIMALSKARVVDDNCVDAEANAGRFCDSVGLDAAEKGRSLALTADIAFAVGIVGLGAGTYLILSTSPDPATGPTGTSISLQGRF